MGHGIKHSPFTESHLLSLVFLSAVPKQRVKNMNVSVNNQNFFITHYLPTQLEGGKGDSLSPLCLTGPCSNQRLGQVPAKVRIASAMLQYVPFDNCSQGAVTLAGGSLEQQSIPAPSIPSAIFLKCLLQCGANGGDTKLVILAL